jgi:hypothetical protein
MAFAKKARSGAADDAGFEGGEDVVRVMPVPKSRRSTVVARPKGDGPKTKKRPEGCDRVNAQCMATFSGGILVENSARWNYITSCLGDCRRRGG